MKKRLVLLPLLFCLLLSACGSAALDRFEALSAKLNQAEALSFTAELTALYPDRAARFSLRYSQEDGVQRVTVLSPASISGISARIERGGTSLEYDGLILDTGDLDDYGLSPMSALPLLVDALCRGLADAFWTQEDGDVVKILYDDHTDAQVWFTDEMIPTHAELICGGTVTVACNIMNWS